MILEILLRKIMGEPDIKRCNFTSVDDAFEGEVEVVVGLDVVVTLF